MDTPRIYLVQHRSTGRVIASTSNLDVAAAYADQGYLVA